VAMPTGRLERLVRFSRPQSTDISWVVHTIHNPYDGDPDLITST
jgi:hypothetical protein